MIKECSLSDCEELYNYQRKIEAPYMFETGFEDWKASMFFDVDGEGRTLFREIKTMVAYDGNRIVGYIQYGNTAFGFDDSGEISDQVSHPIIRMLYFDEDYEKDGTGLLQMALDYFHGESKIYAFFHYFGMFCYARHGKLFEKYDDIQSLLKKHGFVVEHENVYYASEIKDISDSEIEVIWKEQTSGGQQSAEFRWKGKCIGECEIHYIGSGEIAYLRWIHINDDLQNNGQGSKCMGGLRASLKKMGIKKLDTDTAINNVRAQHYYEKNAFVKCGITKSFYKKC